MKHSTPQFKAGLMGEFRLVLRNADGSVARDTGWFRNRIVDNGLTQFGQVSKSFTNVGIGDGAGATVDSQTDLNNRIFIQSSNTTISNSSTPVAPNYEWWTIKKWRVVAGDGTGTIREVGLFSSSSTPAGNLYCRQEVSPEIVKGATQVLDIFYKHWVYPPTGTKTGTVVIDGITYDWETSCYDLDNANTPAVNTFTNGGYPNTYYIYNRAYSGIKAGPLDANPSGTDLGWAGASGSDGDAAVTLTGLGFSEMEITWGLSVGNGVDYIRTITYKTQFAKLNNQCQFTQQAGQPNPGEGIPKDNTEELTTKVRFVWGRYVP